MSDEDRLRAEKFAKKPDGTLSGAAYAGLGFQFALAILLFLYVGSWLDKRLGTSWLVILGAFVGAAGGFYSIYRKLMAAQRADRERRAAEKGRR